MIHPDLCLKSQRRNQIKIRPVVNKHTYSFKSLARLNKCEPVLKVFALELLNRTPFDLTVLNSTIRTVEKQREFVRKRVSRTMKSKHLVNDNNLSEAVDIIPYIKGINVYKMVGSLELFEEMHEIAQTVCQDLDLDIRSGVCWTNINTVVPFDDLLWGYRSRKYMENKKPFFDGPHFETVESFRENGYPDV